MAVLPKPLSSLTREMERVARGRETRVAYREAGGKKYSDQVTEPKACNWCPFRRVITKDAQLQLELVLSCFVFFGQMYPTQQVTGGECGAPLRRGAPPLLLFLAQETLFQHCTLSWYPTIWFYYRNKKPRMSGTTAEEGRMRTLRPSKPPGLLLPTHYQSSNHQMSLKDV